jgi:sodium transport system permease protein
MKMSYIIFRKELLDTIRDRRTIISMIVVPLLLIPLLISISSRMYISQAVEAREKTLTVGLLTYDNAGELRSMLLTDDRIHLKENVKTDSALYLIEADHMDIFIEIEPNFDQYIANLQSGTITVYFKSTDDRSIEKERVIKYVREFEQKLMADRLQSLGLDESVVRTIDINERNLATIKERLAEVIGGLLPYMFIIFCFMGGMYPAIDLAAGEKERGTLETLLTSPARRLEILIGKFGVVALTGILTAILGIVGLYIGFTQVQEIPTELVRTILGLLEPQSIILLLSLLFPLTIFFASVLLSLSIYAKSYKEAQSIISPMMIVVIVPAFLGMLPGVTLNTTTALIPILNVSLMTKAIIAGTVKPGILVTVYLSLILFAGLSLIICSRIFNRESIIFR